MTLSLVFLPLFVYLHCHGVPHLGYLKSVSNLRTPIRSYLPCPLQYSITEGLRTKHTELPTTLSFPYVLLLFLLFKYLYNVNSIAILLVPDHRSQSSDITIVTPGDEWSELLTFNLTYLERPIFLKLSVPSRFLFQNSLQMKILSHLSSETFFPSYQFYIFLLFNVTKFQVSGFWLAYKVLHLSTVLRIL